MKARKNIRNMEDSGVPVSSMIDIVFLLIIFFVVTIDIDRETSDLEIFLPIVASGTPLRLKKSENLIINIRKNGNLTVDGNLITEKQLASLIEMIAKKWGRKHSIVIRGDQELLFKDTSKVIKLLGNKGFSNVSFNAELSPPNK